MGASCCKRGTDGASPPWSARLCNECAFSLSCTEQKTRGPPQKQPARQVLHGMRQANLNRVNRLRANLKLPMNGTRKPNVGCAEEWRLFICQRDRLHTDGVVQAADAAIARQQAYDRDCVAAVDACSYRCRLDCVASPQVPRQRLRKGYFAAA
jgi:hypothetical protein